LKERIEGQNSKITFSGRRVEKGGYTECWTDTAVNSQTSVGISGCSYSCCWPWMLGDHMWVVRWK